MHFIYDNTGRFIKKVSCSPTLVEENVMGNLSEGGGAILDWVGNINPDIHYYSAGVVERPLLQAAANRTEIQPDGLDTFILSGLPIFDPESLHVCNVIVSDINIDTPDILTEVNDGEFGFTTIVPGLYSVLVSAFPYMPKTWVVAAL